MKKILVLAPRDAAGGFAIAGPRQREAAAETLAARLDGAIADAAIGLIVIDERLVEAHADDRIQAAERQWPGAIVVLPSPGTRVRPEDDYARRLIRRAIGYQVRVQL